MAGDIPWIEVRPASQPVTATVRLPGSKSYTNRALLIAALADGCSTIRHALFSDDTDFMAEALRRLGLTIEAHPVDETFVVSGAGFRVPAREAALFVGNAGTAARFLTAYVALGDGTYHVDGDSQMHKRPIEPLLDALRQLGVNAQADLANGCLPVTIRASGLAGGSATMPGSLSSQYFSALLLVAPAAQSDLTLNVIGDLVSKPYIDVTGAVMQSFGVELINHDYRAFQVVSGQRYLPRDYDVEPDASAASYFFAAAAVTGGRVRVEGLGQSSAQGDLRFVDVLELMGCAVTRGSDFTEVSGPAQLRGVEVDMSQISDVAQTLAAIAPFAAGPVTIRNISHIRRKETDRVAAVATELTRLGANVEERADGWRIQPSVLHSGLVQTYRDHRMAMSFAVTGLRVPGIRIDDPSCVSKTFPDFFQRLDQVVR